jgi:hypothetical protein
MKFSKPRCVLVYAVAPEGLSARDANLTFNEFVADLSLPLVLFHDHFLEVRGGVAVFYVTSQDERDRLESSTVLVGWKVDFRPLIFSFSPSAFDEQIAYTMQAYRDADWSAIQQEKRPAYTNPVEEADTAEES